MVGTGVNAVTTAPTVARTPIGVEVATGSLISGVIVGAGVIVGMGVSVGTGVNSATIAQTVA